MRSIRKSLLLSLAAASTLALVFSACVTFMLFRRALLHEFDALLGAKARTLVTLAEAEPGGLVFEFQEHGEAGPARPLGPDFFEARDADGNIVATSGHSGRLADMAPGTLEAPRFRFAELPDGRAGRMVAVQFTPRRESAERGSPEVGPTGGAGREAAADERPATLLVARDIADVNQAIGRLGWMLVGVSALTVGAVLVALGSIVHRSLRPLDSFARHIAEIGESDLALRIPSDEAPTELAAVIRRFNELLERLDAAFHRERTFSADLAHELRTPMAGLLATIQVTLSRPRDDAEYRRALEQCQQITQDAHRLVETLLSLAQTGAGRRKPAGVRLELYSLAESEWARFAKRAQQKRLAARLYGAPGVYLKADAHQMRIVLANLFDNAVEYTKPGGSIDVTCRGDDSNLVLQVVNGGCDIQPDQVGHVFEQFWRADAARTGAGGHAGLGLPLARRVVESLGGTISASLEGDRFVVTVQFGAAAGPGEAPSVGAASSQDALQQVE